MIQEQINELIDKSTPQWLSDQRLSEDGYKSALLDCRATNKAQAVKIESMREALEMVKPIIEGLDLTHRSSETCEMLNAVYRAIKEEG